MKATLLCLLLVGCAGGGGGSGDAGVSAIINGPTQARLTSFWQSPTDKGCIVGHGPGGEQCAGALSFAIAADGTAIWSTASYGYFGTSTWTQVGDRALLLEGLPFAPTSLNIDAIAGSLSDGAFTGDTAAYSDVTFTLQNGVPPGWCATPRVPLANGQCVDPQTDSLHCGTALVDCTQQIKNASGASCVAGACGYTACSGDFIDCDGDGTNGCETTLVIEAAMLHATGVTCASSMAAYASCNGGYLDCDGNRMNGCETQSAAAACTTSLAAASMAAYQLAVDATSVYWSDGTAVKKVDIAGGTSMTLATAIQAFGITVDAHNVYYVEHATGQLTALSLDGQSVPTLPTGTDAYNVVVNATDVYWTNCASDDGWVSRAPLSGGITETKLTSAAAGCPSSLALDAVNYYWSDGAAVWQKPIAGGNAVRLDVGGSPVGAAGLAIDSASVYWTTPSGIWSAPIDGGTNVQITTTAPTPTLAVDGTYVYWGSAGVFATTKTGSSSKPLSPPSDSPSSIAVDGNNVYWLSGSHVVKAPKP